MITKEQNDRLTQVGPGTPGGNLLRRYWHPVGTVPELEKEPVQPVRLLGEDLTLFKTERGEYGLVGDRCAHRAISLGYGIPQANGLRCCYHGWTYDTQGHVVDMPFEPACLPLKITAYPVQELGGMIFAYLGPQPAPLVPRWDVLVREDLDRLIEIHELPCNWVQCVDNAADPVHFEHLHAVFGNYQLKKLGRPPSMFPARHVRIEFDLFDWGFMKRRLLEGETAEEAGDEWKVGHPLLFPNILAVGGSRAPTLQFRIPRDDTHTVQFAYRTTLRKPDAEPRPIMATRPKLFADDGTLLQPADCVPHQDMLAWVAQGPIMDRTREHLVTSDQGVALYHQMLFDQMERVERGEEPLAVIRDVEENEPMLDIRRERSGESMHAFQSRYGNHFDRIAAREQKA
jgi:5,5'-dehydrodivanillate O-demethylase